MVEAEVITSDIDGTAVTFGYRPMPYGPYNPDTHDPAGYYDRYVAEFEYDGIEYEIVAEQMEAEEVVKVVSSIIYGEEVNVLLKIARNGKSPVPRSIRSTGLKLIWRCQSEWSCSQCLTFAAIPPFLAILSNTFDALYAGRTFVFRGIRR